VDVPDKFAPITVSIGSLVIEHGERDDSEACLCGHPVYYSCPDWLNGGGIGGLTIFPCTSTEATDGR
jgi:hypothetical protein